MKYIVRMEVAFGVEADSPEDALAQMEDVRIEECDWISHHVEEGDIMDKEVYE